MSFIAKAYTAIKIAGKAHGPTIMVAGGVTAMGAAAVMVGKATLKLEDTLEPHVDVLEAQKKLPAGTPFKEEQKTALAKAAGKDVIRLYAAPGVLFVAGAALVFGGHRIMLQRNATLAIGFTALQKAYDAYRGRVRENFGEEADQAMLNGFTKREVYNDATGKVEQVAMRDWDAEESDPYNRSFEQGESTEWVNDLGVNKMFIHNQQRFAQEKLNHRNVLYLSEVYESLGFAETPLSRVVGWKVRRNMDGSRDIPIVDFGLDKRMEDDWKYSREQAIYLDFNCQGLIVGGSVQKALEKA